MSSDIIEVVTTCDGEDFYIVPFDIKVPRHYNDEQPRQSEDMLGVVYLKSTQEAVMALGDAIALANKHPALPMTERREWIVSLCKALSDVMNAERYAFRALDSRRIAEQKDQRYKDAVPNCVSYALYYVRHKVLAAEAVLWRKTYEKTVEGNESFKKMRDARETFYSDIQCIMSYLEY